MTTAKIILAGTAALAVVSSAALAQENQTGMITKIDRIHGTVSIQGEDKEKQSGTVGANTGPAGEEFKIQGACRSKTSMRAIRSPTRRREQAGPGQ